MKTRKAAIAVVIVAGVGVIFTGGYAVGQAQGRTQALLQNYQDAQTQFSYYTFNRSMATLTEGAEKTKHENEAVKLANAPTALAAAYTNGMKDTGFSSIMLGRQMAGYAINKSNARSAPQASQVANEVTAEVLMLQTAQNQRIIELLDEINKKTK